MLFLKRQESARRRTRIYVLQLWLLAIPCLASMLVATLFSVWLIVTALLGKVLSLFMGDDAAMDALMNPPVFIISLVLYTAIVFWTLVSRKRRQLGRSGEYVATELKAVEAGRSTHELQTRRLYNIAEEMALAAGIPAPSIYVWPDDSVINALAVGHNTADAALFVSRGALNTLTRDETQALVGYGMSQILNGDTALNARLAAYLHAFNFSPRVAKWWLFFPKGQKGYQFFKACIAWLMFGWWIGLALSIISFPQYLLARLLQAGVGRERQKLADASMLQFTRNPECVRDLLAKSLAIGVAPAKPPRLLDDLAHACFASPVTRRVFDTHVKLEKRIAALDPRFDFSAIPALGQRLQREILERQSADEAASKIEVQQEAATRLRTEFLRDVTAGAVAMAAMAATDSASVPDESVPPVSPDDARVGLLSLLLDNRPDIRARQLEVVRLRAPALVKAMPVVAPLVPVERTLALDMHLPALRALPAAELKSLLPVIEDIEGADDRIDVFEFAVSRYAGVFILDLLKPRAPHGNDTLDLHAKDLSTLFAVVAQSGSADRAAAYAAGMQHLGLRSWPRFHAPIHWARPLDAALARLESLRPAAKELMLESLRVTVKYDREVTPAERELVRAIAAALHCPMPRGAHL